MGFFEDMNLPEWDEDDEAEFDLPDWYGAPSGWIGGVVPLEMLVAKNDQAAIYISGLVAYPTGFALEVNTLMKSRPKRGWSAHGWSGGAGGPHELDFEEGGDRPLTAEDLPPELLRFGLRYSDGRKASSVGHWMVGSRAHLAFGDEEWKPDPEKDLILEGGGGSGSDIQTTQRYWAWPLPPSGPVTFVCEWPKLAIAETSAEIDGEVIRGAADRAEQVWT